VDRPIDTFLIDNQYDMKHYNFTPINVGIQRCFEKLYHPKIKENTDDIFILMDLDGTLVDTDEIHYQCYAKTLEKLYQYDLKYSDYIDLCKSGLDKFLNEKFNDIEKIKIMKNTLLIKYTEIKLINGAEQWIDFLSENNINHVVVTNTSTTNVQHFKNLQPKLNKLKNWITREDYDKPKPSSDCYKMAVEKYSNSEKYIIGIENSYEGYISLKHITKCIYLFTDKNLHTYNRFKSIDAYLINDLRQIIY
jgi:beta-phosphoglucomutase